MSAGAHMPTMSTAAIPGPAGWERRSSGLGLRERAHAAVGNDRDEQDRGCAEEQPADGEPEQARNLGTAA
jgi:hypothetical protein